MTGAPTTSDYSAFGFRIRSELPLPELFAAAGDGEPDVRIRVSRIAASDQRLPGLHKIDGGSLLIIDQVARYWVSGGSEVVVEPEPAAPEQNVRLFLLGSVLGLLVHQRGLLPLHANAVELDGKAVAFMGAAGEGKSTLAAWFHDRGHRILSDDVCVVRFDENRPPVALPGLPRLRLWRDALTASGRDASQYPRSYAGDDDYDKYDVAIGPGAALNEPIPLAAAYLLESGQQFEVRRLDGVESAEAVFAHTYRGAFLAEIGEVRSHWDSVLRLIGAIPVFSIQRTRDLSRYEHDAGRIRAHAEALIRAA